MDTYTEQELEQQARIYGAECRANRINLAANHTADCGCAMCQERLDALTAPNLFTVGMVVRPVVLPPGARTPKPAPGTTGVVVDPAWRHFSGETFVKVAFQLPMRDADGSEWLASADRHFFHIGYYPWELMATGKQAAERITRAAQQPQ